MVERMPIRIGTRGSKLARVQAEEVINRLKAAHTALAGPEALAVQIIRTTGDQVLDRPLAELGGKGLFTKEIETALLAKEIDLAVHSMKDVPTWLPDGLVIAGCLPREDPRDAFISRRYGSFAGLPKGGVLATSSLRRQAQVLNRRSDLRIVPMRGNVGTRLRKLGEGEADAILLAVAGLKRLNLAGHITTALEPDEFLSAAGQGAIGVECRADDDVLRTLLEPIFDAKTDRCLAAERAALAALDGSCQTPIAVLAEIAGEDALFLRAMVALPDGSLRYDVERRGQVVDAETLGKDAGEELRSRAGPAFFAKLGG
ncbi:MAG: hydroxymethylbilane synthase [Alphaproteobacteria bacterium]|nr:hydroxymethylbilane synthase [Alphaproteobacteria bacterium]